jgi:hypothetical protein
MGSLIRRYWIPMLASTELPPGAILDGGDAGQRGETPADE